MQKTPALSPARAVSTAGASVVEMQQAGRWQSPSMPGRYAWGPPGRRRQAPLRGVTQRHCVGRCCQILRAPGT